LFKGRIRRQAFHPLLYENFRRQSYEAKELIIIDSGAESWSKGPMIPGAFLAMMARPKTEGSWKMLEVDLSII